MIEAFVIRVTGVNWGSPACGQFTVGEFVAGNDGDHSDEWLDQCKIFIKRHLAEDYALTCLPNGIDTEVVCLREVAP